MSTGSKQGKELLLAILGPGDIVGEVALLDRLTQTATVTALEPCEFLWVSRYDIMVVLEQSPKSLLPLVSALTGRLSAATNLVEDLAFLKLPSRLAKTLIALGHLCGRETERGLRLEYRLTQQDLAEMVGTTRESINKVLSEWRAKGLLSFARGLLNIPVPEALLKATS
jgi:CRP-like cAMP-binding protein